MTNYPSVKKLSVVSHGGVPVITTELLAELYGTDPVRIRQGHKRNAERFIAGKHYFKLEGKALADLRVSLNDSQNIGCSFNGLRISNKTRSLILWTERGAARHAKMLETDQAWEVFERLEDHYFSKTEKPARQPRRSVSAKALIEQFTALEDAWGKVYASVKTFDPKAAKHMDSVMSHILMFRNSYFGKNRIDHTY